MPAFLEAKLRAKAASKGFSPKQTNRYVYGTLQNIGAMRGNQETAKGRRMETKHEEQSSMPHPHKNLGKYLHKPKGY